MIIKIKKNKFDRRLINTIMRKGNLQKAEKVYYTLLNNLKKHNIQSPYTYVREAFINITPLMGIFVKKRGSKEFIYPKYLDKRTGDKYAIRWLLKIIGKVKSSELIKRLEEELVKAHENKGDIIKEKLELYKDVRFAIKMTRKGRTFYNKIKRKRRNTLIKEIYNDYINDSTTKNIVDEIIDPRYDKINHEYGKRNSIRMAKTFRYKFLMNKRTRYLKKKLKKRRKRGLKKKKFNKILKRRIYRKFWK